MTKSLFTEERRSAIVSLLQETGRAYVKELAARFGVTEDMIRKDLRQLETQGLVRRTHGGAVPPPKVTSFVPYRERGGQERKKALAEAAVKLIEPGDIVFIESSSYTHLMFGVIEAMPNVTIVTNSIYGIPELLRKVNVIQTGGTVHPEDESCYGDFTLAAIGQMNYDKCFLKPAAVSDDWQLTTSLQESMAVKRTALQRSKRVIAIVDEDNWGRADRYNVCHVDSVHTFVTNVQDSTVARRLEKKGLHLIQVYVRKEENVE